MASSLFQLTQRRDLADEKFRRLRALYRTGLMPAGERRPTEAQVDKARHAMHKAQARLDAAARAHLRTGRGE
jgi:outer membrane protein TolC